MSSLPSGVYSTLIQGFLSNIPEPQQVALWQLFAQQEQIDPNNPPVTPKIEQDFIAYLGNIVSPARDELLSEIIKIILELTNATQNSAALATNVQNFLAKYAQQYNIQASDLPVYLGASSSIPFNIDTSDPSKFTFGYDNISVKDISDYVTTAGQTFNVGGQFVASDKSWGAGLGFSFQPPVNGVGGQVSITGLITNPLQNFTFSVPANIQAGDSQTIQSQKMSAAFMSAYAQFTASSQYSALVSAGGLYTTPKPASLINAGSSGAQDVYPSNALPTIPWLYITENVPGDSGSDTGGQAAEFQATNAIVQQRATVNSTLQQYSSGIQAQIQTVNSQSSGMTNVLNSIQSNIKGQVSLVAQTVQQLSLILGAIFK